MGKQETAVAQIGHWIGGARHAGAADRTSEVFNPATGEVSGLVQLGGAPVVDAAVRAAVAAFPAWSETSALNRARVMFRFKELLDRHHDDLARIITREHGKVFSDARG
jgi:malonate-semialdehyde dehydrogenase (acetylating)/methylmalonate-semialdehyde dehydrogenase